MWYRTVGGVWRPNYTIILLVVSQRSRVQNSLLVKNNQG